MALNPQITNAAASAAADAVTALLNTGGAGYLRIYDGAQPATADTALGAQVLLAELRFAATAFGAAANGVATAAAIVADTAANATGTAAWFRALAGNGTTVIFDGTVGTSGADLNLNSVAISAGAEVSVTSFTYTVAHMSTFMVTVRTTATAATANVAAAGIWNPHASARIRLREIWIASTTAGVSNIGLLRTSTTGTRTARAVVLSENVGNDNASLSGFSIDSVWTVQPTLVSATAYLGRWNLPAAVGAGVILTMPGDQGIAIYPGAGIVLVTPTAVILPASDVTFVVDE